MKNSMSSDINDSLNLKLAEKLEKLWITTNQRIASQCSKSLIDYLHVNFVAKPYIMMVPIGNSTSKKIQELS